MYTLVPCEATINKNTWPGFYVSFLMFRIPYSECSPMSYIYRQQIYYARLVGMNDIYYFHFTWSESLKGKLRWQQSCLTSSVQTWPSLQKAVDIWGSGLFSKDVDIPLLNKSFLVFNSLYSRDVPSHKELAFRIDQSFSILLEEIDQFGLFDHTMASQQRNSLHGACTSVVIFLLSDVLFPPPKLCNFK